MFERSIQLLGDASFNKFSNLKIAVIGLGGVGGTAAACLVRNGIKELTIVDFDVVSESNLNRQINYCLNDVGKYKTDVCEQVFKSINPELNIIKINKKVNLSFFIEEDFQKYDYIVDAIDDCLAKLEIAKYCIEHKIKFIMSMGMANRIDPSLVTVTKLSKTVNDPLAKKIRSMFRDEHLDIDKITVVSSTENPIIHNQTLSSMMMVPSEAGLLIISKIIKDIVEL